MNSLVYEHKTIANLIVKWEKLDFNRKRPTQCHRCQQWGHSARNCGRLYRCVKCTDTYEPGMCPRTTREGEAKCVNCEGAHPANSRQCRAFLSYQDRTTRHRAPARFTSTPAPWAPNGFNVRQHQQDFPPLMINQAQQNRAFHQPLAQGHAQLNQAYRPPLTYGQAQHFENYESAVETDDEEEMIQQSVSFTQKRKSHNSARPSRNAQSNFSQTQAKFQSIPDIDITLRMFAKLTDELSATTSQPERMAIMLRYCSNLPADNVP